MELVLLPQFSGWTFGGSQWDENSFQPNSADSGLFVLGPCPQLWKLLMWTTALESSQHCFFSFYFFSAGLSGFSVWKLLTWDLPLLTSSTNPLSRVKRHPTDHWLFDSQSKAPVFSSVLPWSSAWWHLDWKCPVSWTRVNRVSMPELQNKAGKSSEHLTALGGKLSVWKALGLDDRHPQSQGQRHFLKALPWWVHSQAVVWEGYWGRNVPPIY